MKAEIKINAVDLYMSSLEVKKALTWNSLNLKDEVKEKIEFLEENLWKEVFIKWINKEEKLVKISRYENHKIYEFPPIILLEEKEELDEIPNEIQEIQEEKKETFFEKYKIIIIPIIFMITLFWYIIIPKSSLVNAWEWEKKISQFELNYQEINKINSEIVTELENQKEMRKMKDEIDKKINESIKRVSEKEKKQTEIRLETLNLSNKI